MKTNTKTPVKKMLFDHEGILSNQAKIHELCGEIKLHLLFISSTSAPVRPETETIYQNWQNKLLTDAWCVGHVQFVSYYLDDLERNHSSIYKSFTNQMSLIHGMQPVFEKESNSIFRELRQRSKDGKMTELYLNSDKIKDILHRYAKVQIKLKAQLGKVKSGLMHYDRQRDTWAKFLMGHCDPEDLFLI